jgi:hypothetical protein
MPSGRRSIAAHCAGLSDVANERIGDEEPCDWCGRPGRVHQHDFWIEGALGFQNPALCSVCDLLFSAPGEVVEAYYEALGVDLDAALEPLEVELIRKWREKVADGRRSMP